MPPVMSAALVSLLAVGAGRSTPLRSGSESATVPAEDGCVISGGGSSTRTAVLEAWAGVPGTGELVSGAEARVPEAGPKAFLLSAECSYLAGELHPLQKCSVVWGWASASERRLGCNLGDAVRAAGSGV
jgi:hypothetical protein